MSLKAKLTADEHSKLEAPIQALYVKAGDGSFTLDVEENGQLRSALATERASREAAEKKSRELQDNLDKFKGITDPALALNAISQLEKLDTEKLLKEGKLDQVIAQATEKISTAKNAEIKALAEKLAAAADQVTQANAYATRMAIEREVAVAAPSAKVRASAIGDVVQRAASVWKLEPIHEGSKEMKLVPYGEDGKSLLFGKTPPKPVEMGEWIAGLEAKFDHYFEGSGGSGKPPVGAGAPGGGINGSELVLSRDAARDPAKFRAAEEQAKKAGVALRIESA
jgi:hypothetical protein